MSLSEILKIVETVIDAALSSGVIKDHRAAKVVTDAHAELSAKAAAETAATAGTEATLTAK
jgi:hypothetical protein